MGGYECKPSEGHLVMESEGHPLIFEGCGWDFLKENFCYYNIMKTPELLSLHFQFFALCDCR